MVARGEFGHHATIFLVHGDLGMQGVRKQAALGADGGHAGFVARAFKAENDHGRRVYNQGPRARVQKYGFCAYIIACAAGGAGASTQQPLSNPRGLPCWRSYSNCVTTPRPYARRSWLG
ncbi:Uncharacterised protein [Bordetella pertussis]|nr:Uncharacterised protein [Bordetella pertussis]CFW43441.1 Uncharacterised protein [Bordetella pertussis]